MFMYIVVIITHYSLLISYEPAVATTVDQLALHVLDIDAVIVAAR